MMMAGRRISIMVVVRPTLVITAAAELDITSQSVGEMQVVIGMIDAVHQ